MQIKKLFLISFLFFSSLAFSHNDDDCCPNQPLQNVEQNTPVPFRLVHIDGAFAQHIIALAPTAIQKVIYNLNNPPRYWHALPKKLLLVGPPGCGKSSLAKALAHQTNRHAILVEAPFIANEYKNSGPQNLLRLLNEIVKIEQPCVIILDEINVLFKKAKEQGNPDGGMLEALWLFLDECAHYPNIFFIATCNDLQDMPPALKSRFEGEIITLTLPDYVTRQQIIKTYLSHIQHTCSQRFINWLVRKTKNMSIRDIEHVVMQAIQQANFANKDHAVTQKDITDAIRGIKTWTLREYYESNKSLLEKLLIHGTPIAISLVSLLISINTSEKQMALQNQGMLMQKASQEFQEKQATENKIFQEKSAHIQLEGLNLQKEAMKKQDENTQKQMQQQKEAQEFQEKVAVANYELQYHTANLNFYNSYNQKNEELYRESSKGTVCTIDGKRERGNACIIQGMQDWINLRGFVPKHNLKTKVV